MHGQRKKRCVKQSDVIIGLTKINFVFCFKQNLLIYHFEHDAVGSRSSVFNVDDDDK